MLQVSLSLTGNRPMQTSMYTPHRLRCTAQRLPAWWVPGPHPATCAGGGEGLGQRIHHRRPKLSIALVQAGADLCGATGAVLLKASIRGRQLSGQGDMLSLQLPLHAACG